MDLKKQIDQSAGFEVNMEVQWDTLAEAEKSHLFLQAFPKVYFQPLIAAFKAITNDKLGKDALKTSMKMVKISNTKNQYNTAAYTFENGVLSINHLPTTNIKDIKTRQEALQKLLESKI